MEAHNLLTDQEFERQFETGALDSKIFTHEAHLRLAWIHISRHGIDSALIKIPSQLQAYVKKAGAADKYNHTLTIAAIKAVHHYYLKSNSKNFNDFIIEFPQLKNRFKDIISYHYQTNIFISEKAKQEFIEPDRFPFE